MPPAMYVHTAEFLAREPQALVGCDCYAWSAAHPTDQARETAAKAATKIHVYKMSSNSGGATAGYAPVSATAGNAAVVGYVVSGDSEGLMPSKDPTSMMVPTPAHQSMVRYDED
jgi:hypothetical protein